MIWGGASVSSVAQSCPTLFDPMDHSMSGLPVHYQLLEFTQTHVHCVSDDIQPSHLLSSPSPAFNLSQHQGLFNEPAVRIRWPKFWVSDSTPVLPMNTRGSSPLWWTGWISLCPSKSRESSPTPQFKRINSSALSFLHGPTLTCIHDHRKNHSLD